MAIPGDRAADFPVWNTENVSIQHGRRIWEKSDHIIERMIDFVTLFDCFYYYFYVSLYLQSSERYDLSQMFLYDLTKINK